MQVVILCGGLGTRLREETEYKPKPMVEIGGRPILWHIMKTYSQHGFNDFVLCLGYKGEVIKDYFYHYKTRNNDFTIALETGDMKLHEAREDSGWKVTLADTGKSTMTGGRVKRIKKYIHDDTFMLTYGDGVGNVDIRELLEFHHSHGKIGTLTGVSPPSRFGELTVTGDTITSFKEKPKDLDGIINGGFFVFNRQFFDYLSEDEGCYLEREPLANLAEDGELKVHNHKGYWQCMDTYRDYKRLNELWDSGNPPWRVW